MGFTFREASAKPIIEWIADSQHHRLVSLPDNYFVKQPFSGLRLHLFNICCTIHFLEFSPGKRNNAG